MGRPSRNRLTAGALPATTSCPNSGHVDDLMPKAYFYDEEGHLNGDCCRHQLGHRLKKCWDEWATYPEYEHLSQDEAGSNIQGVVGNVFEQWKNRTISSEGNLECLNLDELHKIKQMIETAAPTPAQHKQKRESITARRNAAIQGAEFPDLPERSAHKRKAPVSSIHQGTPKQVKTEHDPEAHSASLPVRTHLCQESLGSSQSSDALERFRTGSLSEEPSHQSSSPLAHYVLEVRPIEQRGGGTLSEPARGALFERRPTESTPFEDANNEHTRAQAGHGVWLPPKDGANAEQQPIPHPRSPALSRSGTPTLATSAQQNIHNARKRGENEPRQFKSAERENLLYSPDIRPSKRISTASGSSLDAAPTTSRHKSISSATSSDPAVAAAAAVISSRHASSVLSAVISLTHHAGIDKTRAFLGLINFPKDDTDSSYFDDLIVAAVSIARRNRGAGAQLHRSGPYENSEIDSAATKNMVSCAATVSLVKAFLAMVDATSLEVAEGVMLASAFWRRVNDEADVRRVTQRLREMADENIKLL